MSDALLEEPTGWPQDARRDRLIGDWYLYQRTGGHRTSTDDLITAWYAVHRRPQTPERYLDLGCGIGSVLLMVSHKLRPAQVYGIEGQAQSATMARRAISELPANECEFRVDHADFRDVDFAGARYPLITGSPPYFPFEAGTLPKDPQRRACRFEARGGVEGYMEAASRALAPDGGCYIVFQTAATERVRAAAAAAALHITGVAEFLMRSDRAEPFLSVFELSHQPTTDPHHVRCAVRDGEGEITSDYMAVRRQLGVS